MDGVKENTQECDSHGKGKLEFKKLGLGAFILSSHGVFYVPKIRFLALELLHV